MTDKTIAIISVARSDYGRLFPVIEKIKESPLFNLKFIAAGNHSSDKFGKSLKEIEASGVSVDLLISHKSESMAEVSADILTELSRWLEKENPDCLIILGDRFEMLAASQAAFLTQVPIIHIGGGYETAGAIDDQIRHAITHFSEVHLAATEKCRKRIIGLLGHDKNVFLTGAPDLEILSRVEIISKESFYDSCNLEIDKPFVLVTLHPETLASEEENEKFVSEFEKFLISIDEQILITAPCADPGSELIFKMIDSLKEQKSSVTYIESLGMKRYAAAMKYALLMAGNSSSGIIESATMGTPVLNAGHRQKGRECNMNVINSAFDSDELLMAYQRLKTPEFKKMVMKIENLYGDSGFSSKFINVLNNL